MFYNLLSDTREVFRLLKKYFSFFLFFFFFVGSAEKVFFAFCNFLRSGLCVFWNIHFRGTTSSWLHSLKVSKYMMRRLRRIVYFLRVFKSGVPVCFIYLYIKQIGLIGQNDKVPKKLFFFIWKPIYLFNAL